MLGAGGPHPENSWVLEINLKDDIVRGCYNKTVTHATGLWKAENALLSTLPLFFVQLALIMFFSRLFRLLLSPFHQPPIIAHMLGGIVLGPSLTGRTMFSRTFIFPVTSILTLETMANLGLIYYMFLTGLEVNFKPILNATKRVWTIAIAGIVVPIPLGYILHKTLIQKAVITSTTDPVIALQKHRASMYGPIFWGITLATTNFSELTGVLADVKLLHSEVGRTALSMSIITDLTSWLLLVIAVSALSNGQVYTICSTTALIIFCVFALRPALSWIAVNTKFFDDNNKFDMDQKTCFVMAGVLFFGFITDAMGTHSILGAFLFGAILPNKGHLKHAIIERVEEFVSSFLLPLFFVTIGLRTYVHIVFTATNILLVVAIVVSAFLTKIIVTFVAALLNKMPFRDSLALGVATNTKGLLAAVILNAGRELKVLDWKTFSLMTVAVLIMTAVVGPVLRVIYKSTGSSSKKYRRRSIRSIQLGNKQSSEEFRILTCIHSTSNVNGIISLLKASNPTKESPISAFAVHLVEHSGHASAMLILHNTSSSIHKTNSSKSNRIKSNSNSSKFKNNYYYNHVVAAFEKFEAESEEGSVSVEAMTTVSSYSSMHEDICNIAEEKRADLIIVPFHNQSTVDGDMTVGNINANNHRSLRWVNKNLLENAPCPVAIFVDRGLTDSSSSNGTNNGHCAMLFIGGPDDREALAYAWRMVTTGTSTSPDSHVITSLTLLRFIPAKEAAADHYSDLDRISSRTHYDHVEDNEDEDKNILQDVIEERHREKQLDQQYIESFIVNTRNQAWIQVRNEVVSNVEDTLRVINEMGSEYGLYIVGRGQSVSTSPVTLGLSEWGDCPELGPLGDTLVSSKFVANASVLIVHQGATLVDE